jgi:hypothetical protein
LRLGAVDNLGGDVAQAGFVQRFRTGAFLMALIYDRMNYCISADMSDPNSMRLVPLVDSVYWDAIEKFKFSGVDESEMEQLLRPNLPIWLRPTRQLWEFMLECRNLKGGNIVELVLDSDESLRNRIK